MIDRASQEAPTANVDAQMAEWREAFQAGNSVALLLAIRTAIRLGLPPPEWAATAFSKAVETAAMSDVASWDDVFGKPHRANESRPPYPATDLNIWRRVTALRSMRPKPADVFAIAADEFGISVSEAKHRFKTADRLLDKAVGIG